MFTVNIQKLKETISEKGTTQEAVAKELGIYRSTFYRKLRKNGKTLTMQEVHNMAEILSLTQEEITSIFFEHQVA